MKAIVFLSYKFSEYLLFHALLLVYNYEQTQCRHQSTNQSINQSINQSVPYAGDFGDHGPEDRGSVIHVMQT